MSAHKGFFRSVYDSLIESRTRQAEREVAFYRHHFGYDAENKKIR